MLAQALAVVVSVCLSVTRRYCVKTAKHSVNQTTHRHSPVIASFLTPTIIGGRPPYALKFGLKVTHPFIYGPWPHLPTVLTFDWQIAFNLFQRFV